MWAAASLACMTFIFLASSQNSGDSSRISGSLTRSIVLTILKWFAPDGKEVSAVFLAAFETFLRKAAHFFIFFIFGFCTINCFHQLIGYLQRAFWISILWCSAYAITDEVHQLYVPGRAGMWQDWLIDTAGALLGIGIVVWVITQRSRKKTTR